MLIRGVCRVLVGRLFLDGLGIENNHEKMHELSIMKETLHF